MQNAPLILTTQNIGSNQAKTKNTAAMQAHKTALSVLDSTIFPAMTTADFPHFPHESAHRWLSMDVPIRNPFGLSTAFRCENDSGPRPWTTWTEPLSRFDQDTSNRFKLSSRPRESQQLAMADFTALSQTNPTQASSFWNFKIKTMAPHSIKTCPLDN